MVEAPIVLVLCGQLQRAGFYKGQAATKLGDWFLYDLGIATQSVCLTAHALGLGTVVVGLFDQGKAKEALGVPEGYELVTMLPLGYPEKIPAAPKKAGIASLCIRINFKKTRIQSQESESRIKTVSRLFIFSVFFLSLLNSDSWILNSNNFCCPQAFR